MTARLLPAGFGGRYRTGDHGTGPPSGRIVGMAADRRTPDPHGAARQDRADPAADPATEAAGLTVGVLGGTGDQGRGLARRLATG